MPATSQTITSQTIKLARVVCIFFVMFVHVYAGYSGFPVLRHFDILDVTYRLMADLLGRASLPLLTIVSGWLALELARPWRKVMRARLRTLVIPLFVWNGIMLAALMTWALISGDRDGLPRSLADLVNALLAATRPSANIALAFLRDLFVVSALSPLLIFCIRRFWLATLLALLVLAILVPHTPLILRTQILFFFALGLWIHQIGFLSFSRRALVGMATYVTLVFGWEIVMAARREEWQMPEGIGILLRICISGLLWQACRSLAGTRLGHALIRLEPFTFLAFCSHIVVFLVLAVPGQKVFGNLASPLYPIYFFLQPLMGYAAAIALARVLAPFPGVLRVLNAGRNPWTAQRRADADPPRATSPV